MPAKTFIGKMNNDQRRLAHTHMKLSRFIFLLLALLGVLFVRQYGESWDELKFYKYADLSLQAYRTWLTAGQVQEFGNTYDNYGPAYVMLVALVARGLGFFIPCSESDLRHLLYFFTFLAGVWAFHSLAMRWLSKPAALGATLLFATQPIFVGHAFISPKDIPFLSFFLLSLLFGLRLFEQPLSLSLSALSSRLMRTLLVLTTLWFAITLILFFGVDLFHDWIDCAVRAASAGAPNLISWIASDIQKVKPEIYTQRYFTFFVQGRAAFFILSSLALIYLYRKLSPNTFHSLISIFFPAALLGVATSIRILGPLAGLLVGLYALRRSGKTILPILFTYFVFALVAMYATWPYLWPDPLGRLIVSLRVMSQYPWPGQVLFDGVEYTSTNIPFAYLPALLGIQLTEPVWALFIAGLVTAGWGMAGKRENTELLGLAFIWFFLPLAGFILSRTPLYDNFRQVFFILPPVFLVAGVVFERCKRRIWQISLIALVTLPGLIGILCLHPYEYIYYNAFIGGERGAFRRFELDYWGISYREAAGWLNENAPHAANIWVDGPAHLLDMYLREDLNLYSTYEIERAEQYDYVVSTTRYNLDLRQYPDAEIVYAIKRNEAVLAVIKEP